MEMLLTKTTTADISFWEEHIKHKRTTTSTTVMNVLQSFMKTLLNNYEGAPPTIVSDNARVALSSGSCGNKAPRERRRRQQAFAIKEANTTQSDDDKQLSRWAGTSPLQIRRRSINVVIPKTNSASRRTSRNSSCSTSRPLLYCQASPPICPIRKQSFESL
jgi:hypothetical protein